MHGLNFNARPVRGVAIAAALAMLAAMLAALLAALLLAPAPIGAQDAAQPIAPFETVRGTIAQPGGSASYTFSAFEGHVVSFLANGSGLDPILTLTDSSGVLLTRNDDFAYPGRSDALLQAVTLPRTGDYTLTLSGFGSSSGDYALTFTRGYPEVAATHDFESQAGWTGSRNALTADEAAGRLTLGIDGISEGGYASLPEPGSYGDFYARVEVLNITGRNGWIIGMTLRQDQSGYYLLTLNNRAQWRLTYREGTNERIIRNWTNHPAIRPDDVEFSMAVIANGRGFDVFYDDVYVGQANDPEYDGRAGGVGLWAGTIDALNSETIVEYDDLVVTVPLRVGDQEVIPEQIAPGPLALTIQELERRRVIPTGGQQGLTVPESSGRQISPGVNRVLLGRGATFGPMVAATTFEWSTAGSGVVGCGLIFDHQREDDYTLAFIDQAGGYGLSRRSAGAFAPGLFGEDGALANGSHELLLVRTEDRVLYYIDRRLMGSMDLPLIEGEIGNAIVNYEQVDTECRFRDTWVWRLN